MMADKSRIRKGDPVVVVTGRDRGKTGEVIKVLSKKNKVLVSESQGYDEYYFVAGGSSLAINDGELDINGDMTRGKMAKGFTNYIKGKVVNRVLLNKFVEQIA